jgi:hypothetical protein
MRFLDTADRLRILVLVLPSHITHRLQPLDVGIFSALSTAYTNQLNTLQYKSLGLVSITKRLFYSLFREPFKEAFIKKPIIQELITSLKPQTPLTCRAVRRIYQQYKLDHSESKLELIRRGHERLATQHSIDNHIINRL